MAGLMANSERPRSYLELTELCDSFPYIDIRATPYSDDAESTFYQFLLPGDTRPHGFIRPSVVAKMPWTGDFKISHEKPRTVQLLDSSAGADTLGACNQSLRTVIQAAIEAKTFTALNRPHGENFKILGANYQIVQIQRSAAPLFGIACRGAHMTMFVRTPGGLRIWVPRRSSNVKTYPGMLDSSVAGGTRAEESPFECLVHEADEEASLPEDLIRSRAQAVGVISYVSKSGEGSGAEPGLMVPECIYVYDLEVGPEVIPRPRDDEVEEFYLWNVETVKEAMARREFKPNCAVVMIDFFVRHGIITAETERDYLQIVARMHRMLPVPTAPSAGAGD